MGGVFPEDRVKAAEVLYATDDDRIDLLKRSSSFYEIDLPSADKVSAQVLALATYLCGKSPKARARYAAALYGVHRQTLRRLLFKGSKLERLAVLANPCIRAPRHFLFHPVLREDELHALIAEASLDQLIILFKNPGLDRESLADAVRDIGTTDSIHMRELVILNTLSRNPLLSEKPSDADDGMGTYFHEKLNHELIALLSRAPVDINWAHILEQVLDYLYIPPGSAPDISVLSRWQSKQPDSDSEDDAFSSLREKIAFVFFKSFFPTPEDAEAALTHQDEAVRSAANEMEYRYPERFDSPKAFDEFKTESDEDQRLSEINVAISEFANRLAAMERRVIGITASVSFLVLIAVGWSIFAIF